MPEQRYAIGQDLKEAQVMAAALTPYVYQDTLYKRVGGKGIFSRTNIPYMTLGAVLLRLRRLRVLDEQLSSEQAAQLGDLEAQHLSVRREWRKHYGDKLVLEANSRLKVMVAFFEDCRDNPQLCASAYMPEALRRTIVQENVIVLEAIDEHSAELEDNLTRVDATLRRFNRPSAFIWSEMLQPVYDENVFWWLYQTPQAPD